MGSFSRAKVPLLILLLTFTFFLVSFSTLVYNLPFWESLQEKYDVNETIAKPLNIALQNYFLDSNYQTPLVYNGLTEKETAHMVDVKKRVTFCAIAALFGALASVFFIIRQKKGDIIKICIGSTAVTWVLPLLFFFVPFDPLFSLFHHIFFSEGTYLFSWGDLLITVYPQGFFQDFAIAIVKRAYIFGLISLVIAFCVKKFK